MSPLLPILEVSTFKGFIRFPGVNDLKDEGAEN
jgi:hypothetical protein